MSKATLYDLAAKNRDVRFSPFCWLAKYALNHKQVAFDTVALGFLPKTDYPDQDYGKLPMLQINDELIKGSDTIVAWLDENIAEHPLIEDEKAHARVDQANEWLQQTLFPALGPLLFTRVAKSISDVDRDYFVTTREKRFGISLDALAQTPGQADKASQASRSLADMLDGDPFLSGKNPALADYLAVSPYLWQRSITSQHLYEMAPAAQSWLERMLDLHDGYGRSAKSAEC